MEEGREDRARSPVNCAARAVRILLRERGAFVVCFARDFMAVLTESRWSEQQVRRPSESSNVYKAHSSLACRPPTSRPSEPDNRPGFISRSP